MTQLHVPVTTPRPRMTTTSAPKPTPPRCEVTEICKKTCKYNVKLGKTGSDGCPTCLCVKTSRLLNIGYRTHFTQPVTKIGPIPA